MKFQIIRKYNNSVGYGKIFDTKEEAEKYLKTNPKIADDECDGFYFEIREVNK